MMDQWGQVIFSMLDQELLEAAYAETRQQEYWISLPDGTRLCTNVYSPSAAGT